MKDEVVIDPTSASRPTVLRRISWAAIFAGLTIALVSQLVLTVLGIAIAVTAGATGLNPYSADQSSRNFGFDGVIWLISTSIISLFLGGWVAGRSSGYVRGGEGSLHGFVMWGLSTLITAFLLSAATSGLLSGAAGIIKNTLSVANQTVDRWTQTASQTKATTEQKPGEIGTTTVQDVSTAGWASFIVLVIGGLAAAWGGAAGARAFRRSRPDIVMTRTTSAPA